MLWNEHHTCIGIKTQRDNEKNNSADFGWLG